MDKMSLNSGKNEKFTYNSSDPYNIKKIFKSDKALTFFTQYVRSYPYRYKYIPSSPIMTHAGGDSFFARSKPSETSKIVPAIRTTYITPKYVPKLYGILTHGFELLIGGTIVGISDIREKNKIEGFVCPHQVIGKPVILNCEICQYESKGYVVAPNHTSGHEFGGHCGGDGNGIQGDGYHEVWPLGPPQHLGAQFEDALTKKFILFEASDDALVKFGNNLLFKYCYNNLHNLEYLSAFLAILGKEPSVKFDIRGIKNKLLLDEVGYLLKLKWNIQEYTTDHDNPDAPDIPYHTKLEMPCDIVSDKIYVKRCQIAVKWYSLAEKRYNDSTEQNKCEYLESIMIEALKERGLLIEAKYEMGSMTKSVKK